MSFFVQARLENHFTAKQHQEKQQILTRSKLELGNVWQVHLKNHFKDQLISNKLSIISLLLDLSNNGLIVSALLKMMST